MSKLSVSDVKDKLGLAKNDDDDQRHKFLMKHILQLETEISGLKQQLDEERNQFSYYIDQISRLNGSREEMNLEYESREREMQQEIFSLKQQLESYRNSETRDMLLNQGLIDIADSTPSQQIAHLLIDRARLMDVIDELKERIINHSTPHSFKFDKFDGNNFVNNEKAKVLNKSSINELILKVQQLEINNNLLLEKLMKVSPQNFNEFSENLTKKNKSENLHANFSLPVTMEEAIERLKVAEVEVQRIENLEKEKDVETKKLNSKLDLLANHTRGKKDAAEDASCSRDEQNSSELYWKHGEKIEMLLKSVDEQLKDMKLFSDQIKPDNEPPVSISQLQVLQKEFELLKVELLKMMTKYDSQENKYRDHKLNCKNKLFKLKEAFKKEKQELFEKIDELQNKLELKKEIINREVEYKKNLERTVENLILEQKNFMIQITMQEETILNQKREIGLLTVKGKHLEIEISSDRHLPIHASSHKIETSGEQK